ncbi:hypothetical protein [Micromonospora lutea]|uniref:hypothetical protein n=1 Tax=Micromonospora lutea TaxID=419825 RepID=UPI00194F48E0|nr:hypothetical protein [Micromonospora lutea]
MTAGIEAVFSELPPHLVPPAQVVDLPDHRGVGRGALMYHLMVNAASLDPDTRTFAQNDVYLVTRSGEHFRVGRTPAAAEPLHLSLSPDGRWLGVKRDGRWQVRDLAGTTKYEVAEGYELWLWSTDARSLLLAKLSTEGRTFGSMALPGGTVSPLGITTSLLTTEVAFLAGRELATFDMTPMADPATAQALTLTVQDVVTGVTRTLPVVAPEQLEPGETAGPLIPLWHAGGNPPTIWAVIGRPNRLPTNEGSPVAPSVALLGVDATSGAATARIETSYRSTDGPQLCLGVVADGVVLQRWTGTGTELIVVDPQSNDRRVVTTFPTSVTVLAPGTVN